MLYYAVCYDIEDDGVRTRVARLLGETGNRVQRSVFEVWLADGQALDGLKQALREAGAGGLDVVFYRLCERCQADSSALDGSPAARFPAAIIL
jgi:CRISPR-associated endonuclease Cas2